MRRKEEQLGGWQEEFVTVSQQGRVGFKARVEEQSQWSTRFRVRIIWVVAILMFGIVAARVTYLHVFEANQQLLLSETNHIEQVQLQLSRDPYPLPQLKINPDITSIFDFKYEDFTLEGYDPHPGIKAPVAI